MAPLIDRAAIETKVVLAAMESSLEPLSQAAAENDAAETQQRAERRQRNSNTRPSSMPIVVDAWPAAAPGEAGAEPPPAAAAAVSQALGAAAAAAAARGAASGEVMRESFAGMLLDVRALDAHLFSPEELVALEAYERLAAPAQCLLLRLFMRKGPWFKVNVWLGFTHAPLYTGVAWEAQNQAAVLLAAGR